MTRSALSPLSLDRYPATTSKIAQTWIALSVPSRKHGANRQVIVELFPPGDRKAIVVMRGRQRIVEIGGGSHTPSCVQVLVDLPLAMLRERLRRSGPGSSQPGNPAGNAQQPALGGPSPTPSASSPGEREKGNSATRPPGQDVKKNAARARLTLPSPAITLDGAALFKLLMPSCQTETLSRKMILPLFMPFGAIRGRY